jgi:uncharacterized membrane protein YeaQ/YmgE (transglycosylase-associated protein family)
VGILWWLVIGLIAGALAGRVVSGHGYGILGDIVVGIVGAWIGGFLVSLVFGSSAGGFIGSLVVAFLGAVILLLVLRRVVRGRGI